MMYASFASGNSAASLSGLQSCLASVQGCMSIKNLKLKTNLEKTEVLFSWNERQGSKYLSMFPDPIVIVGVQTNPVKFPRNNGVIFNKNVTFGTAVCSSCSYYIRDLGLFRLRLDFDSAKLLANAFVSNRPDNRSRIAGRKGRWCLYLFNLRSLLLHCVETFIVMNALFRSQFKVKVFPIINTYFIRICF